MKIEFTEIQERAARLLGHIYLVETRLFRADFRHEGFADPTGRVEMGELEIGLQLDEGSKEGVREGAAFFFTVSAPIEQALDDESVDSEPLTVARFEVTYGALYKLEPAAADASMDEVEAFGMCVASMTLWPFVRALVSRALGEMNLPNQVLLPMITQRQVADSVLAAAPAGELT